MGALRNDLRAMTADATAGSAMIGLGESYLPAFVLALSGSQIASGLVATLPMMAGAVLQLASPYVLSHVGSYRRWVVGCALVQAAAFLPLIAAACLGEMPLTWIFTVAAVYWACGLGAVPAWNVWVELLVPKRLRATYFARRTCACQWGILGGFILGGMMLQGGDKLGYTLAPFAVLFFFAASARLLSAGFAARQRDHAVPRSNSQRKPGPWPLLRGMLEGPHRRILAYLVAIQVGVYVAAPFFTPYMLVHLKLSYTAFVAMICSAYAVKVIALPSLGSLAGRFGAHWVLRVSSLMIIPLPAMWMLSDHLAYLFLLQALAGIAWGGYELAMLLLFFETIPAEKRVGVLTIFNLANATAIVLGSALGAAWLGIMGSDRMAYLGLFGLSAVLRAAASPLLTGLPVLAARWPTLATRPIAMRPNGGSVERPVLPALEATVTEPHPEPEAVPAVEPAAVLPPTWESAAVPENLSA